MRERKKKIIKITLTILLVIFGLMNIFPFVFMLSSSFKPLNQIFTYPIQLIPETFIITNYIEIFSERYDFIQWYINTVVMVLTNIVLKLFVVSITAYAFAKMNFRGKNILFVVLLSSMMIPPDVVVISKYVILQGLGLTNTMWSLVLPAIFDVFFVFMLRQFFLSIPDSLSEAAIIDGCGHFRVYSKIVLPLAGPAVATMIIFTFIWAWNDYLSPYIFITDSERQMLSVGMKMFQINNSMDYGLLMAAATLVLVPVIILFLCAQKYFIQGIATSGIKS